jgi:hypothetical protein
LKKHAIGGAVGLALMMMMTLGSFSNAFADSPPAVHVDLSGGGFLTESSSSATLSWSTPVTSAPGVAQTAVYSFPVAVTDARGSGLGWNLTITSTTFTGGGHSLADDASTITGVGMTPGTGTDPVASTPLITIPTTLPGASATAVKFYSAKVNTGMGTSTITPTISITIPANAYAVDYSSTITLAAVSTP